jgi:hypothetical protein
VSNNYTDLAASMLISKSVQTDEMVPFQKYSSIILTKQNKLRLEQKATYRVHEITIKFFAKLYIKILQ